MDYLLSYQDIINDILTSYESCLLFCIDFKKDKSKADNNNFHNQFIKHRTKTNRMKLRKGIRILDFRDKSNEITLPSNIHLTHL